MTVDPSVAGDLAAKTKSSPPAHHVLASAGQAQARVGPVRPGRSPKDGRRLPRRARARCSTAAGRNQYAFGGDRPRRHHPLPDRAGFRRRRRDEGVVNHDSADGWLIEHARSSTTRGAGLMAGARQQIRANCLRDNGQYGMNAYKAGDRISASSSRATSSSATTPTTGSGRGRAAAAPAASSSGPSTAPTYAATGCTTTTVPGCGPTPTTTTSSSRTTCIEANDGAAFIYETSYNAIIRNNIVRRNNCVEGQRFADRGDTFPFATVYLSESGGDPGSRPRTDKIDIYRQRASRTTGPGSPCGRTPTGSATARPTPRPGLHAAREPDIDRCAPARHRDRPALRRLPLEDPAGGHPRQPLRPAISQSIGCTGRMRTAWRCCPTTAPIPAWSPVQGRPGGSRRSPATSRIAGTTTSTSDRGSSSPMDAAHG